MEFNNITREIIGAAIEVHRRVGPGLLESAYRTCLAYELRKRGLQVAEEKEVPIIYDHIKLDCGFRADLVVNDLVVVELKAKMQILAIDKAQTLSYLRLMQLPVGLLINFHEEKLINGVHRVTNESFLCSSRAQKI